MSEAPSGTKVLVAGIAALVLALGVARFAFTPMIPFMGQQAGLTEDVAGWLAGINYLGYLLGTILVARTSSLAAKDRFYRYGLGLAVFSTLMMAFSGSIWVWGISRFLAGFGTAAGLLAGSGLVMQWRMALGQRAELGVHFAGAGLGIVVGALVVATASAHTDWAGQWLWLSVVGAICLVPALGWLPSASALSIRGSAAGASVVEPPDARFMRLLKIAYALSGLGYVVSATFLVAQVEHQPALQGRGVLAWLLVGLAAIPAPMFWDRVARVRGYLWTLKLNFWLLGVCICLPFLCTAVGMPLLGALSGAVVYGVSFMGIVSLILTLVGRLFPTRAGEVMAEITLGYCIAQIVGPVVAGELAVLTGSLNGAMLATALVMVVGALCLQALGADPLRSR